MTAFEVLVEEIKADVGSQGVMARGVGNWWMRPENGSFTAPYWRSHWEAEALRAVSVEEMGVVEEAECGLLLRLDL